MVRVDRYIEGIESNGIETLCGVHGETLVFEDEGMARNYLITEGFDPDDFDDLIFMECNSDGSNIK